MRLNPFNKASLVGFKNALRRWIECTMPKRIVAKLILLDTHYVFNMVNDMVELLEVIEKMELASFLQDDAMNMFTMVSTTHTTKEVPVVWKGLD
jgi:hypothetical protein